MGVRRTALLAVAVGACWWIGCRPGPRDTDPLPTDSAAIEGQAEPPAIETAAASQSPGRVSSPFVGTWELVTPGRLPGIRLTVGVDSADGERVHGRLVHYLAGNLGVEASRFAPFVGVASGDSVRIPIRARDGSTGFLFEGRLRGDTISLWVFAIGPDTLRGEEVREVLVRQRE